MQSFGAFFNDNKTLAITLLILVGILSIAVLIFLYRLLFGRRLHMAGNSRARQPRLGVVDAFDLDRQRQLVLVRRDNVEHLIMIGGPNDLVIESAFVRMQPTAIGPMVRDKEVGTGPTAPMAPIPASLAPAVATGPATDASGPGLPSAPVVAANGRDRAVPPLDLGEPLSLGEPLDLIPAPAQVSIKAAPEPSDPLPPDPLPPARDPEPPPPPAAAEPEAPAPRPIPNRFSTGLTPRPAGSVAMPPLPPRPAGQASTLPPRTPTLGPRPMPLTPLSRGTSAASLRRDPPPPPTTPSPPVGPVSTDNEAHVAKSAEPAAPAPPTAPADPVRPRAEPFNAASPDRLAAGSLPTTLDTLESLEEEMARLLGRPPTPPEKH